MKELGSMPLSERFAEGFNMGQLEKKEIYGVFFHCVECGNTLSVDETRDIKKLLKRGLDIEEEDIMCDTCWHEWRAGRCWGKT